MMYIIQEAKIWGGDSFEANASVFTTEQKARMSYMRRRKLIMDAFKSIFGEHCICRYDKDDPSTYNIEAPVTFSETETTFEIWYKEDTLYHYILRVSQQIPDTIY